MAIFVPPINIGSLVPPGDGVPRDNTNPILKFGRWLLEICASLYNRVRSFFFSARRVDDVRPPAQQVRLQAPQPQAVPIRVADPVLPRASNPAELRARQASVQRVLQDALPRGVAPADAVQALYAAPPVRPQIPAFNPGAQQGVPQMHPAQQGALQVHPIPQQVAPRFRGGPVITLQGASLGAGTYGTVYACMTVAGPRAVKYFTGPEQYFNQEADILERVGVHPHIVGYHGTSFFFRGTDPVVHLLFMDMVVGMSLHYANTNGGVRRDRHFQIIFGLASGLDYLHAGAPGQRERIFHGDVKSANVMLREHDLSPVLVDFGVAQVVNARTPQEFNDAPVVQTGTLPYLAPEFFDRMLTGRGDYWALGVAIYEMFTRGVLPFLPGADCHPSALEAVVGMRVKGRQFGPESSRLDSFQQRLIWNFFAQNPNERISCIEHIQAVVQP